MTKETIDDDVLIEELANIKGNLNFCNDVGRYWLDIAIETIKELVTETQETLDDDWNHDLSLLEDYDEPYLISNGCRIAWGEGFGDNAVYHPIGDFMAFDDEYFRQSVKMWKPL